MSLPPLLNITAAQATELHKAGSVGGWVSLPQWVHSIDVRELQLAGVITNYYIATGIKDAAFADQIKLDAWFFAQLARSP